MFDDDDLTWNGVDAFANHASFHRLAMNASADASNDAEDRRRTPHTEAPTPAQMNAAMNSLRRWREWTILGIGIRFTIILFLLILLLYEVLPSVQSPAWLRPTKVKSVSPSTLPPDVPLPTSSRVIPQGRRRWRRFINDDSFNISSWDVRRDALSSDVPTLSEYARLRAQGDVDDAFRALVASRNDARRAAGYGGVGHDGPDPFDPDRFVWRQSTLRSLST